MDVVIAGIGKRLIERREMLVVAESCTGGGLASACTDIAGSSAWFERGFVTYSNEAKHEMLGVSPEIISTYGAVSQQTAEAMVSGALRFSRGDWGIAITGVAGPGGGTEINPVGSVWLAWMQRDQVVHTSRQYFAGDRQAVRQQSIEFALEGLAKLLK